VSLGFFAMIDEWQDEIIKSMWMLPLYRDGLKHLPRENTTEECTTVVQKRAKKFGIHLGKLNDEGLATKRKRFAS
jgi:hypothetical protein